MYDHIIGDCLQTSKLSQYCVVFYFLEENHSGLWQWFFLLNQSIKKLVSFHSPASM